ncbi:MAG: helix-turn-helix transcriptional regulator [Luteimonas sp.]
MSDLLLLQQLGAGLRAARNSRGLTQAQLGQRAGLPRLKVIQVERGEASVSIGAYADIANALGQTLTLSAARRPTLDEVGALLADG